MDTLKLNSKQIQAAIDQLTAQPEGMNKLRYRLKLFTLMTGPKKDKRVGLL